jgi:hypothetical protein
MRKVVINLYMLKEVERAPVGKALVILVSAGRSVILTFVFDHPQW